MTKFSVPLKEEVSTSNKALFDQLKKTVGFVPNIYALMAYSDTALDNYIKFENAPNSFSKKEVELIKLVVSQENGCQYCLSAHTVFGKMNGFSEDQMMEIRSGSASFNGKLNALAIITKEITAGKGQATDEAVKNFLDTGYTKGALIELVQLVAVMVVTNYLHNLSKVPIDFASALPLEELAV
ncbi:MAG: carboxymuconolactone decarboxylase family protein [Ferruginibacter sp.]